MITIKTGKSIRTSLDMIPVTDWLNSNIDHGSWKWVVSDEWIPGWGHPMLVEFDDFVTKEVITQFTIIFA